MNKIVDVLRLCTFLASFGTGLWFLWGEVQGNRLIPANSLLFGGSFSGAIGAFFIHYSLCSS